MFPLITLVGPTAIGKTALSLALARLFPVEIISADSRLFYRGMDIGTAKPTKEEQAAAPHHMIDICAPDETITLGEYQTQVYKLIPEIHARGHVPLLLGGTGQYVWAIVEGWGIPRVSPHPLLRAALENLDNTEQVRWLQQLDPTAAATLDLNNPRRVIRALEVTLVSGVPISQLQAKHPPPYNVLILGLTCGREKLYQRIDKRVDQMIVQGLVAELQSLQQAGYRRHLPAMSGLGYRQLWPYLDGEQSLDEAIERIKFETHRFVRHQNNWFKPTDPRIIWLNIEEEGVIAAANQYITRFLQSGNWHHPSYWSLELEERVRGNYSGNSSSSSSEL